MTEDPRTVELRRLARAIESSENELEIITKRRNELRDKISKLYAEELEIETS